MNYASCEPMRDTMLALMTPALDASFTRNPADPNTVGDEFRRKAKAYIDSNQFNGREWSSQDARTSGAGGRIGPPPRPTRRQPSPR